MKRLFFFSAFILIMLSGFGQNPTSESVLNQIKAKIGNGRVLVTPEIASMVKQYCTLQIEEARIKAIKDKVAQAKPMTTAPFCYECVCACQGHTVAQGCGSMPPTCTGTCRCGCTRWNLYISMCSTGYCNQ